MDETGQNVHIFEEVFFFELRTPLKQNKTTTTAAITTTKKDRNTKQKNPINSTYLVSVGCGKTKSEGTFEEISR